MGRVGLGRLRWDARQDVRPPWERRPWKRAAECQSPLGQGGLETGGLAAARAADGRLFDPGESRPFVVQRDDASGGGAGVIVVGAGAAGVLMVAVGTGVGGAVVLDGRVHHGARFLAGEMGHMPSGPAGAEPCTCGRTGHLEAVAAGPQIARRYREATGAGVTGAQEVERLANAGDAVARRVYREAAVALGEAIAAVVTVLDPERVIVSGGLARSGEVWWGPLRETVRAEVLDLVAADLEIVPAALGTTAPIVGAAHQARLRLATRLAAGA